MNAVTCPSSTCPQCDEPLDSSSLDGLSEINPHLRLFSLPDGRALGSLAHDGGPPFRMLAADRGRSLITECANSVVRKFNMGARSEEWSFSEHTGPIALSPDGATLACGPEGGTVRLWHLPTRREISRFSGYQRIVRLEFAPDGSALLLSDGSGETQILRAASFAEAAVGQKQ